MVIYVNKQLFSLEAPMCVIDDERRLFSTYTTNTALRTFIRGPSEAEAKKRSHRTMFDRSAQKRPLFIISNIILMAASKTLAIDLDKALRLQNVVQSGDFSITQRP